MDGNPTTTRSVEKIDDPGEYNQRRRIETIHDATDRVFHQRRHALDLYQAGRIDQNGYLKILREAVESLLHQLEHSIRAFDEEQEGGRTYWEDVTLGSVEIPPDGEEYQFVGLASIMDFPDPYVAEWEDEEEPPAGFSSHPDYGTVTREEKVHVPESVLMAAVRAVMQFMNEVGLDVATEDSSETHGFRELESEEVATSGD
jgi:hypothetical protein